MSAQWVEQGIPVAVFGASLLGSLHCVGMCGGLVAAVAARPASQAFWQLGRLAAYLLLGAVAGTVGGLLISVASGLLISVAFVRMGITYWRTGQVHVFVLPKSLVSGSFRRARSNPFLLGTLAALLPCGWLHGFVLAAAATGSLIQGSAILFVFWLGTVPALSAVPAVLPYISRMRALPAFGSSGRFARGVAAMLLISAGVIVIGQRFLPLLEHSSRAGAAGEPAGSAMPQCH